MKHYFFYLWQDEKRENQKSTYSSEVFERLILAAPEPVLGSAIEFFIIDRFSR